MQWVVREGKQKAAALEVAAAHCSPPKTCGPCGPKASRANMSAASMGFETGDICCKQTEGGKRNQSATSGSYFCFYFSFVVDEDQRILNSPPRSPPPSRGTAWFIMLPHRAAVRCLTCEAQHTRLRDGQVPWRGQAWCAPAWKKVRPQSCWRD